MSNTNPVRGANAERSNHIPNDNVGLECRMQQGRYMNGTDENGSNPIPGETLRMSPCPNARRTAPRLHQDEQQGNGAELPLDDMYRPQTWPKDTNHVQGRTVLTSQWGWQLLT
jgi:hypothetical protein